MLKRPSSRRKSGAEPIELNLVPMLDTFVTLIGFLLYTMAFLALSMVETPLPMASPKDVAEKLKEKPLQLTVSFREKEAEVWSPFEKIAPTKIPNLPEGAPDLKKLHDTLIDVKKKFPLETKVVLAPTGAISYETLVGAMDAMRVLEATDPPIFAKNAQTGMDEALKLLFPEIVFGNILGTD